MEVDQLANLLDYSGWTVGTGDVDGYTALGNDHVENVREYHPDPWGKSAIVWTTPTEDDTRYGGGFWSPYVSVDPAYDYRFSCYTNRISAVGERTLFGCDASPSTLVSLTSTSTTTNPYFEYWYNSSYLNEWILLIGYIYAYTTTTGSPVRSDAGVWRMNGVKIEGPDYSWRFYNTTSSARLRIFYYDSSDKWPTFMDHYVYPRIEKCDGTEPSLKWLLRGGAAMFLSTKYGSLILK